MRESSHSGLLLWILNVSSTSLNTQTWIDKKAACKDQKSTKMCQTLKEHNNGKGCKKRSTQKKCKKTCGLCDPGKFQLIYVSFDNQEFPKRHF